MFTKFKSIIAIGSALAATILFASPAVADSRSSFTTDDGILHAVVMWFTSSQTLTMADTYPEGWGVIGSWHMNGIRSWCVNERGAGTVTGCPISTNRNMTIFYSACSKDGSTLKGCGLEQSDATKDTARRV
jgi:hypothetical protein